MRTAPTARLGASLLELIVALSITALIVLAVTTLLARQQRLYRILNDALSMIPQRHDAAALLAADIRTMNTSFTPAAIASDTAFDIAATIGASSLCAPASAGATNLALPPRAPNLGNTLTTWLSLPDEMDELLLYRDDSATPHWESHPISNVRSTPPTTCTAMLGVFPAVQITSASAYEVTLETPVPSAIPAGTPVRFIRYGRYSVYRASDAQWYVGYRRCTSVLTCNGVQPLIGPFEKSPAPPVTFHFYAPNGSPIPPGTSLAFLARIDITVHHPAGAIPGLTPTNSDSTVTSVALRNHP